MTQFAPTVQRDVGHSQDLQQVLLPTDHVKCCSCKSWCDYTDRDQKTPIQSSLICFQGHAHDSKQGQIDSLSPHKHRLCTTSVKLLNALNTLTVISSNSVFESIYGSIWLLNVFVGYVTHPVKPRTDSRCSTRYLLQRLARKQPKTSHSFTQRNKGFS